MSEEIRLVDRGGGLQLSTSRITVQDLVPYFQEGCSHEEIQRWIPTLSCEEIILVEQYYRDHKNELDEEDRLIRKQTEEGVKEQRRRMPKPIGGRRERLSRLHKLLHRRRSLTSTSS